MAAVFSTLFQHDYVHVRLGHGYLQYVKREFDVLLLMYDCLTRVRCEILCELFRGQTTIRTPLEMTKVRFIYIAIRMMNLNPNSSYPGIFVAACRKKRILTYFFRPHFLRQYCWSTAGKNITLVRQVIGRNFPLNTRLVFYSVR